MKKLLTFGLSLLFLAFSFTAVSATEDVTITSFDISMNVDEHGLIQVDQKIDTQFNILGHGIYAFIPQRYDMTWDLNGQTYDRSYYFPVRHLKVIDANYESQTDDYDNIVLKIGDADVSVTGPQSYHYTYTLQMRDLDLEGYQAFYLNLVGSGWEMPMDKVNFEITLPSAWPSDITFTSGAYGSTTPADVQYTIVGNTLKGTLNAPLGRYEALTIFAPLPNAYFSFIPPTDYSLLALGGLALLTLAIVLLYLRFGKDDPVVQTVEFYPVPGYSSAMTGFVYDGLVDTKDVVSLIIEWAYKGYLSITEEKGKDDFTLTKLKDISAAEIRAEQTLFNAVFSTGDIVTSSDLKFRFYTSLAHAKSDILRYFQGNKEHAIFDNKATAIKVLAAILAMAPVGAIVGSRIYVSTYQEATAIILALVTWGILSGYTGLWIYFVKTWPSVSKLSRSASILGLGILSAILGGILMAMLYFLATPLWMIPLVLAMMGFNIALISVMDRRTPKGIEVLGKIQGLKHFIEVAEKDRLEALVKDDPQYFYRILPYAYVLNVSNVWSKKFESIAIPQASWYVGPHPLNTYLFMNSLNHTLSSMTQVMSAIPQRGGTGGTGGFGGGGGFSGGGFGGGGGGHW